MSAATIRQTKARREDNATVIIAAVIALTWRRDVFVILDTLSDNNHKPTKMAHTFSVTVFVHRDGTLSITDSDITGLFIEVSTFHELLTELRRVASRLLKSNHGLTDEQIAKTELLLDVKLFEYPVHQQKTSSLPSLPGVSWGDNKHAHSLQYA
ncbi:MAG: hypothetical protein OXD43_08325 [Bacteroidetes bacterium]|nr:hypothetical protein [Bacteroidota bacterium]